MTITQRHDGNNTREVAVKDMNAGDVIWPTMREVVSVEKRAFIPSGKRRVTLRYTTRRGMLGVYVGTWGAETKISIVVK